MSRYSGQPLANPQLPSYKPDLTGTARVGPKYKMYILGDASAKVDWSSLDDVRNFALATLARIAQMLEER
ncbi:hypothetical protein GLOTRDRAFT_130442 [Gloeophyllum trabeum ATCC 11539]|uniref:Uncharacterized protein n=1 Tax=Gloeophyllum trabeum (strain ATCC 11539 / FP-39264 / Madison 617) TaxID=670483 RepID=S7Q3Q8_GLOTA|nr:uncharacterized protein GLOTRDRAFT_130442 [Gloeophyllum trabeum ATCC 11539]EPQ54058.1 hypothetical protein GLOTRDRAFT_130442 [Gloeophyllum trabeum ATCC 11539]